MSGLTPLRGTWLAVLVMLIPALGGTVAAASPWNARPETVAIEAPQSTTTVTSATGTQSALDGVIAAADLVTPSTPSTESNTSTEGPTEDVLNDELNHGQFVRESLGLTDGVGAGCITRQIAQSDLGKNDLGRDSDDGSSPTLTDSGEIDPTTVDLECVDAEHQGGSEGSANNGKPDNGNSDNAKSDNAKSDNAKSDNAKSDNGKGQSTKDTDR